MAKTKPYTAAEKRIINKLALAFVCADIEKKVIKPTLEKSGKTYSPKEGYLEEFFKSEPQSRRAWHALQKEINKIHKDYLAYSRNDKAKGDQNG